MRADVDSSASTMRPLTFSRERSSSSALDRSSRDLLQLGGDHPQRGRGSRGACPRRGRPGRCRRKGCGREHRVGQAALLAHLLEQARGGGARRGCCRARAARSGARRRARCPGRRGRRGTARCPCPGSARVGSAAAGGARRPRRAARRAPWGTPPRPRRRRRRGRRCRRRRSRRWRARSAPPWKRASCSRSARADDLGAAEDRAPERVGAEDRLAEDVEDQVLRIVLVHRDLLEHDLALGLELVERAAARPCPPSRRRRARGDGRARACRPTWSPCRCRR